MDECKKLYQRNYYINRRDHVLSLASIPREQLTPLEKTNLDKYIKRFRPKSTRVLRTTMSNHAKGEKIFKIEKKQILISFD